MAGPLRGIRTSEAQELVERLGFFITDVQKLRMQRKELSVLLITIVPKGAVFSEKQGESLVAIAGQKEVQDTFEIVIKNLQSIQKSVEEILFIKEVRSLMGVLGQELQALVTVSGILKGVRSKGAQGVQIANLKSAVTDLSRALMREEQAADGVVAAAESLE